MVTVVGPANVADAPAAGAVNVTCAPTTGVPAIVLTKALSGAPNVAPGGAFCAEPETTVTTLHAAVCATMASNGVLLMLLNAMSSMSQPGPEVPVSVAMTKRTRTVCPAYVGPRFTVTVSSDGHAAFCFT